ncbi:hypothetical protein Bxe_C0343 [Paraburkholderia xenovorans LB400]|uniref:Uncharacterized protein n=1 Tax=Paraburkholderia xenovorans (strain LB400) TaxID=266265 RepID=Q13I33_PARXL|nr:hypothetical protein Bxe_C0343 [Paraburkholderia xenovorans LB400]
MSQVHSLPSSSSWHRRQDIISYQYSLLSIGSFWQTLPFRETCHTGPQLRGHPIAYNLRMPDVAPPRPFPDTAPLSALRAWYAGVGSRQAVERYCPQALEGGQPACGFADKAPA